MTPNYMVIAFLSGKGGAFKTTLSTLLAGYLVRAGHSVLLIDTDGKKSTSARRLMAANKELGRKVPVTMALQGEDVAANVDFSRYEYIIIDGTPDLGTGTRAVMSLADMVVSPVEASHLALWELRDTFETFCQVSQHTRFYPVLGRTKGNEDLTWAIQKIVSAGMRPLRCAIPDSVDFKRSLDVVLDKPKSPAAHAVSEFIGVLFETLKEQAAA